MNEKINNNIIAILAFIILIIIISAISDRHYAYSRDIQLKKEINTDIKIEVISKFDTIIYKLQTLNEAKNGH